MRPVLILGASGMLGQGVLQAFQGYQGIVKVTARSGASLAPQSDAEVLEFDASRQSLDELSEQLAPSTLILNCIGIIKPYIRDDNLLERDVALRINGLFPYDLARFAEANGHEVLQIASEEC